MISPVYFLYALSILLILTTAANNRAVHAMQIVQTQMRIRSLLQPVLFDFGNFTSNSFNQSLLPPINISPQNASLYQDSIGTTHIVGVVRNPFPFPIRQVQVTASAHNALNQLISTSSAYTELDQLNPKETAGFDMVINNAVSPPNYQLSVSYERADSVEPVALYLYMGQAYVDSAGTYHLLGEVTNYGSNPTSFVKVYGIFYDAYGRVIDVEHTYTTPSDLQPGQKAPFDLTISNPNPNLIRFQTIDVQSEDYSLLSSNPLLGQVEK